MSKLLARMSEYTDGKIYPEIPQNVPQNVINQLNDESGRSNSFTLDIQQQVQLLIQSAQKQCEKEKFIIQEQHRREILELRAQIQGELHKAFEKNLVIPLKEKIMGNENEIRALKDALKVAKEHEGILVKEKNALQNQLNIYKIRIEKLEIERSQFQFPTKLSLDQKTNSVVAPAHSENSQDIIVVTSDPNILPTTKDESLLSGNHNEIIKPIWKEFEENDVPEKEFQGKMNNDQNHEKENINPFVKVNHPDKNPANTLEATKALPTKYSGGQVQHPTVLLPIGQIVSAQNTPKTVGELLQMVELKLHALQKVCDDESTKIRKMFMSNVIKYADHIATIQEEIMNIKNVVSKDRKMNKPGFVKKPEHQVNFMSPEQVDLFDTVLAASYLSAYTTTKQNK